MPASSSSIPELLQVFLIYNWSCKFSCRLLCSSGISCSLLSRTPWLCNLPVTRTAAAAAGSPALTEPPDRQFEGLLIEQDNAVADAHQTEEAGQHESVGHLGVAEEGALERGAVGGGGVVVGSAQHEGGGEEDGEGGEEENAPEEVGEGSSCGRELSEKREMLLKLHAVNSPHKLMSIPPPISIGHNMRYRTQE